MYFIKLFTAERFDNVKFANMLQYQMNVRARAVDDGVILDRDAFNATESAYMPQWAWLNKSAINNPLRTRPATPDEWPDLSTRYRYSLAILYDDADPCQVEQSDGLNYITQQAEMVAFYWRKESSFRGVAIIDNDTGEVVSVTE